MLAFKDSQDSMFEKEAELKRIHVVSGEAFAACQERNSKAINAYVFEHNVKSFFITYSFAE